MKKILIACAVLLSLGSINNTAVFAQTVKNKSTDLQNSEPTNRKAFIKVIKQYQDAESKVLEQKYMDQTLHYMRTAMTNSKAEIEPAIESKDENKMNAAIKKQEKQGALYNKLISATKDENIQKVQIMNILKEFSTTL